MAEVVRVYHLFTCVFGYGEKGEVLFLLTTIKLLTQFNAIYHDFWTPFRMSVKQLWNVLDAQPCLFLMQINLQKQSFDP